MITACNPEATTDLIQGPVLFIQAWDSGFWSGLVSAGSDRSVVVLGKNSLEMNRFSFAYPIIGLNVLALFLLTLSLYIWLSFCLLFSLSFSLYVFSTWISEFKFFCIYLPLYYYYFINQVLWSFIKFILKFQTWLCCFSQIDHASAQCFVDVFCPDMLAGSSLAVGLLRVRLLAWNRMPGPREAQQISAETLDSSALAQDSPSWKQQNGVWTYSAAVSP